MTNRLISARDTFSVDHPEQRRLVNGREWGCIRAGHTGPALLLLPGTLGRADIFWQQIAALEGQARILSLSYPASGGVADWTADIVAMTEQDGLHGAVVLGSSLGGYVAQYATGCHPALFSALIAANTLPDASVVRDRQPYALDLERVEIDTLRNGFLGGLDSWRASGHAYGDLAELLINEVRGRIPAPELRARLLALKNAPALPAQSLPESRIFTVESDDDHLITPAIRAALRTALRPARAFRFRAASHFPYVVRADDYTALLRESLGLVPSEIEWPDGKETVL
jgi:pimeloyl-ACP methyl ester carboxylesterase